MNAKKLELSKFDFARGIFAEFKYTVSKGRETYGYNICTLYVNGGKVSSCNGGGYDMQGTALGNWIEVQFQEELSGIPPFRQDGEGNRIGFYGLTHRGGKFRLDGGCGMSCMTAVLKAVGYEMQWLPTKSKKQNQYVIMPVSIEVTK